MRSRVGVATLAVVLAACQPAGEIGSGPALGPAGEVDAEGTNVGAIFTSAAAEFDVPVAILQSIAWAETRWQMVEGEDELGNGAAFGIMALRGGRLEKGAARAGVSVDDARSQLAANVRAAAALLSDYADELGLARDDLGAWASAVAEYSSITSFEGRQAYVHAEVFDAMHRGVQTEAMALSADETQAHFPLSDAKPAPGPDYAAAVWRPSPNFGARAGGPHGTPAMVIIHDCEGGYSGCWSYLASSASGVSAHYVVSANGGEISELVREKNRAWHIAASYDCQRNSGKKCDFNGVQSNGFTVGIEHAGFASQKSWDTGLLDASAKLTCAVTKHWGIPRDKYHIVGHGQLQPYNRVDPGPNWPWSNYLQRVTNACDGGPADAPAAKSPPPDPKDPPAPPQNAKDPAPLVIVVDSNNAFNGPFAHLDVSGNWTSSNNVAGYYDSGYWWRKVGATADAAKFRALLAKPMKMKVQAWWPAAADRSASAPFLIYDAQGVQLDTVYVDQRAHGSQWVDLGSYSFTAGWNVVALSRWTTGGGVVVADAVRFTLLP